MTPLIYPLIRVLYTSEVERGMMMKDPTCVQIRHCQALLY